MKIRLFGLFFGLCLTTACGGGVHSHGAPDAGVSQIPGSTMCVGGVSTYTRDQLATIAMPGACASIANLDTVCTVNVSGSASTCGKNCFLNNGTATNEELETCTTDCVIADIEPEPSRPCIDCYAKSVECARQHCLSPCLFGFTPACYDCREQNGCLADFLTCAGIPSSPRPIEDAGVDSGP